ncbi:MAG: hypothetical protein LUD12_05785 [Lachnospiraceae bacterium]|nr:hypothetical protein [Lachnospiraceae bacterium]
MASNTNQEKTVNAVSADFSAMEYDLECAADLCLCLSVAAGSGNVPEEQLGNALYALHSHLSGLCSGLQAVPHGAESLA